MRHETGKRANGVVYTRRWVVDLVLDDAGYRAGEDIIDKVVVEPSCGDGAFLEAIAERLASEAVANGRPWADLAGCVVAYDLDAEAVAHSIAAAGAALTARGCDDRTARAIASGWVRNGDFILDCHTRCDFVVGNPPYVRATDMPRAQREAYRDTLESFSMGCDLYIAFYDHGLDILRPGGRLCYICADRWLQNSYGRALRSRVAARCDLENLIRMHGVDAFDMEVDSYPAVTLIVNKPTAGALRYVNCMPGFGPGDVPAVERWLEGRGGEAAAGRFEACEISRPEGDGVYPLGDPGLVRFVTDACSRLPTIEEAGVRIGIGIATGRDKVFITNDPDLVEPERMVPVFVMRDHRRHGKATGKWLVNPWNEDGTLVDLERWPRLKSYLETHEADLRKRAVARRDPDAWYRTIDKLRPGLTDRDLLLMPDMATTPDPVLSRGLYPSHACYWLASDNWDMRVLGGLIMADTTKGFIDTLGVKMRGGTLRFQAQYLRLLHVPPYEGMGQDTRAGLAAAFGTADRRQATAFAQQAYREAMK